MSHLIAPAPGDPDAACLASCGSEAMEAAHKMARQFYVETGQPQRGVRIARNAADR